VHPDAELVTDAWAGDPALEKMAGPGFGHFGRGGMHTKLRAARLAARSGAATVIAYGRQQDVLQRLRAGEEVGTLLASAQQPEAARKRWIAGQLQARGRLVLDAGAVRVLRESGRSLLAVGVKDVLGDFETSRRADERSLKRGLETVERSNILRALEEAGWKVKGEGNAASRLGLKPSTLRSRMKKLGITKP